MRRSALKRSWNRIALTPLVPESMTKIRCEIRISDATATTVPIRSREIINTHNSQREIGFTVCKGKYVGISECS